MAGEMARASNLPAGATWATWKDIPGDQIQDDDG